MNVPLDRVRAARQRLSFIWCSVLAAISLLVVLHLLVAAFQRFLLTGRLSYLFRAPRPPPPSPAVDVPAGIDVDSAPTEGSATADRTTIGRERRRHRLRVPCSHQSALQSPPSTGGRPSSSYVGHDERSHGGLQLPTMHRRSPNVGHKSSMNAEGRFYTDSVVESNV